MSLQNPVEPLHLVEDAATGDQLLVYQGKDDVETELLVHSDSFWASQAQMARIFGVTKQAISKHLKKIFAEGELDEGSVVNQQLTTAADGKGYVTNFYNLHALIAVGYRIEGKLGTMFRIWATDKLFQYLTKGFVIDVRRLENPDGKPDFFDELLEKIRHIRSSEKRMWTRILELASFCTGYDPKDERQHREFFAEIQNTLHWAITQQTACELVRGRVDGSSENAVVTLFRGEMPTVEEAKIAKNLMQEPEIKALNLITSLTLEFFESQAERKTPVSLSEFLQKLRDLIRLDDRPLKREGYAGMVSRTAADKWVSAQIKIYKDRKRIEKEAIGEKALTDLAQHVKKARKLRKR